MPWIGLDIGGANLKAAFPDTPDQPAVEMPFPMWTDHQQLETAIEKLVRMAGDHDAVAVTMTGELADCFETRSQGVSYIADVVERVCLGRRIVYYACDGNWRSRSALEMDWDLVAAANWHATATWGARLLPHRSGMVIDVGSTTTDISRLTNGTLQSGSRNDLDRLTSGELLYIGADRTPICGLLNHVRYGDQNIPLANELFATIGDAAIWKRLAAERAEFNQTADGRAKTRRACGQRMARMLCRDLADLNLDLIDALASQTIDAAQTAIGDAVSKRTVAGGCSIQNVLVAGEGSFLIDRVIETISPDTRLISMSDVVGVNVSDCGPAHAVAVLASENFS